MRICYITNLYPPIQTGTGYYVDQLSRAMADGGHHVLVITCGDGRDAEQSEHGGVHVLRLPSLKLPPSRLLLGFDAFRLGLAPANVRRARQAVADHAIDVIHTCGHLLDLTYLGGVIARRAAIPAACSIHTMIHHPTNRVLNFVLQATDRTIHRALAMRRFRFLLTLDKVMESYSRETYPGIPTIPVPWGVTCNFEGENDPPQDGTLKVLSVGHVTVMRSRRSLIEAIGLLRDQGVKCRLRVVGKICTDAPLEQVRRAGLEQQVEFVGELPREQILQEYRTCDVHAVWISNSGVGSAGMESMYAGLPTMLWADEDQLGFVYLRHMENAILIDPRKPAEIAATLGRLADDPALRRRIGRNAAALAREHFFWPSVAVRMEEIYTQVMRG
jgi:glycosyltransferase involved in cell wall biosynthesis